MQATAFEFRYRFFIFTAIYALSFAIPWPSFHVTMAETLAGLSGHPTRLIAQIFLAFAGFLIVIAAAIRTWATAYLHGEVVHDMEIHSDRLVADGPYRYVRNPLYLGTTLLAAGIGFLAKAPGWLFLVVATTLFSLRLIFREEAGLNASQTVSFAAFKQAVPRLLPSLKPRLPGSGRMPTWPQAWRAESFMWAFAVSLLLFSLTLNTMVLTSLMFSTVAAYGIMHVINSQRLKRAPLKN